MNLKAAAGAVTCEAGKCTMPFQVTFEAQDASSPIARAEYSLDAGPWQYVEPIGKISDSKIEHYSLTVSLNSTDGKIAEHLITVRAYDRFENVGVAKTVVTQSTIH